MDKDILKNVKNDKFAQLLGIEILEASPGYGRGESGDSYFPFLAYSCFPITTVVLPSALLAIAKA